MSDVKKLELNRRITKERPFRICFVCLGNICRSPTAEGIMKHLIKEEGLSDYFEIDSAGTSAYHIGEPANSKSQKIANEHGVQLDSRGRRIALSDLETFDLLLAMDNNNFKFLSAIDEKNIATDKILMLREFDPEGPGEPVPDPYAGGIDGFENVFQVIKCSCQTLLEQIKPYIKN